MSATTSGGIAGTSGAGTAGTVGAESGSVGSVGSTTNAITSGPDQMTSSSSSGTPPISTTDSGGETSTGANDESRRVFLSSETQDGDLGGALGADDACQGLADDAVLGGTWRAFIIDTGNELDRHTQDGGPFVKLDGTIVADSWADFTDGQIESPIDLTEIGTVPGGNVWTGFFDVGGASDNWCSDWTFDGGGCLSIGVCGSAGESNMSDSHWDGFYIFDCSAEFRLYCIEQ